jgi:hypothetical protein
MRGQMVLATTFMSVALVGCASDDGAKKEDPTVSDDVPAWYDSPPEGCAVDSAKFRGNRSMAKASAETRARDGLAKQIKTKTASIVKDYGETGEAGGEGFVEELTSRAIKEVSESQDLYGARTVKTKKIDDEFFALVCLDPEVFATAFDRMAELSDAQKEALRQRAANAFKDLDAELERLKNE